MATSAASSEEYVPEQDASVFRLPSVAPAAFTFRFQWPEALLSQEEDTLSSSGATAGSPGGLAFASPIASSVGVSPSLDRTSANSTTASPMGSSCAVDAWSESDSEFGVSSGEDTEDDAWLEDIPPILDLTTSAQGHAPVVISGTLDTEGHALRMPVVAQHQWLRAVDTVTARVARRAGLFKASDWLAGTCGVCLMGTVSIKEHQSEAQKAMDAALLLLASLKQLRLPSGKEVSVRIGVHCALSLYSGPVPVTEWQLGDEGTAKLLAATALPNSVKASDTMLELVRDSRWWSAPEAVSSPEVPQLLACHYVGLPPHVPADIQDVINTALAKAGMVAASGVEGYSSNKPNKAIWNATAEHGGVLVGRKGSADADGCVTRKNADDSYGWSDWVKENGPAYKTLTGEELTSGSGGRGLADAAIANATLLRPGLLVGDNFTDNTLNVEREDAMNVEATKHNRMETLESGETSAVHGARGILGVNALVLAALIASQLAYYFFFYRLNITSM